MKNFDNRNKQTKPKLLALDRFFKQQNYLIETARRNYPSNKSKHVVRSLIQANSDVLQAFLRYHNQVSDDSDRISTQKPGVSGASNSKVEGIMINKFIHELKSMLSIVTGLLPAEIEENASFQSNLGVDFYILEGIFSEVLRKYPEVEVSTQDLNHVRTIIEIRSILSAHFKH